MSISASSATNSQQWLVGETAIGIYFIQQSLKVNKQSIECMSKHEVTGAKRLHNLVADRTAMIALQSRVSTTIRVSNTEINEMRHSIKSANANLTSTRELIKKLQKSVADCEASLAEAKEVDDGIIPAMQEVPQLNRMRPSLLLLITSFLAISTEPPSSPLPRDVIERIENAFV